MKASPSLGHTNVKSQLQPPAAALLVFFGLGFPPVLLPKQVLAHSDTAYKVGARQWGSVLLLGNPRAARSCNCCSYLSLSPRNDSGSSRGQETRGLRVAKSTNQFVPCEIHIVRHVPQTFKPWTRWCKGFLVPQFHQKKVKGYLLRG